MDEETVGRIGELLVACIYEFRADRYWDVGDGGGGGGGGYEDRDSGG